MKKLLTLAILPLVVPSVVSALTVNEALTHVVNTNPEVRERIENYKAVEQDKTIAYAEYLPVVDLQVGVGKKRYDGNLPEFDSDNWTATEGFIRARENIFHGFGTQNDVEQQYKRLTSAEYYVMEKVSQLGLDMVEKYLDVIKAKKLLKLAIENHNVHKEYYEKIKSRTNSGAGTQGDMEQISGRLALSKSNVIVAENNLLDAETNFMRIYGYDNLFDPSTMKEPKIDKTLIPKTLKSANELAAEQYPTLLAMEENVRALEAGHRQAKENYYPWVDLELKQTYNNNHDTGTLAGRELAGEVEQSSIMLIATWNLYNGGADKANREKAAARMFEESDRMLNARRLVSERLKLSWAAKERLAEQLKYLKKHRDFSKKTLDAYNEEFGLGKRTLLDVLDVKNEYYLSRKAYIDAQYNEILAKYRVIENVGNLPKMISVTSKDVLALERNTQR